MQVSFPETSPLSAKNTPSFCIGKEGSFSEEWEQTFEFGILEREEETDDLDKFSLTEGMDHDGKEVNRTMNKQRNNTQINHVSLGTQIIILKYDETKTVSDNWHESEPV